LQVLEHEDGDEGRPHLNLQGIGGGPDERRFEPGTVVVIDRGYVDFAWFGDLTPQDVYFVTRLKTNVTYEVVERRPVPARAVASSAMS
jgi:hypothetical protein